MKNSGFAKQEVVEEYLSALLSEDLSDVVVQRESVAKLLQPVRKIDPGKVIETKLEDALIAIDAQERTPQVDIKESAVEHKIATDPSVVPSSEFQALFFNVAGLTLALPLTALGGIHKMDKIGPLFGKPDWFKGVMRHRDKNLHVVDTAKWVMPEKYDEKLAESINYQYLIMLDTSGWGLACENLINTSVLQPSDVKWRQGNGKRPWLSGMIKQKMCALINVNHLIDMLDKGLSSNDK
jgi:purine-binding chemotaxis protein CheW